MGVALQTAGASFVLDDLQRIVEWSSAAATALGIPEEAALGQRCYEVVRGYDPFGRAVCRSNCLVFKALRSGRLSSSCSLLVDQQGSRRSRLLCRLTALPRIPGGAVATLAQRQPGAVAPATTPQGVATPGFSTVSGGSIVHDLAALATLSATLSPERLEQSIEETLEWLRQVAEVEAAELFLVEPGSGDMLLTAYRGPFRSAFSEITRFQPGVGFPGLVLSGQEPIVTRNLLQDPRYLRTRVKERGFHSYVCVPLVEPRGVIGVLNVAARRPDLNIERALRLLTWVSRPITTVLEAGLLRNRLDVTAGSVQLPAGEARELDDLVRAVLHYMVLIGKASSGSLFLYDESLQGLVRRVTEGESAGAICPAIGLGGPQGCPALAGGHGVALYGPRYRWPLPCQQMPHGGGVACCLPLVAGGEKMGVVRVEYAGRGPSPPTKYLASLLGAAEQGAQAIRHARRGLESQRRALSLQGERRQQMSKGFVQAEGSLQRLPQGADGADAGPPPPFLEIRCFGPFELYRQGKLVVPEMFQRRGALSLLKILLIHRGRPVPRDVLVEMLWPEADPQTAANRLYVLVHALRRVVEPSRQGRPWLYVCSNGDRYYFNPEAPYWLDVTEFREYVGLGERLERGGDAPRAVDAYEAAVNLYRGDLLEDEPYAEWCWEERERLRETYLDAIRRLVALHMEQGAPERCVELCRRALKADPLREEMHQGLIRALWVSGWPAEALRQYEACRALLERELSVAPSSETERLVYQIRDGHKG